MAIITRILVAGQFSLLRVCFVGASVLLELYLRVKEEKSGRV